MNPAPPVTNTRTSTSGGGHGRDWNSRRGRGNQDTCSRQNVIGKPRPAESVYGIAGNRSYFVIASATNGTKCRAAIGVITECFLPAFFVILSQHLALSILA